MIAFVDMAVMVEWQRPEQDTFEIQSDVARKLNPTHNTNTCTSKYCAKYCTKYGAIH